MKGALIILAVTVVTGIILYLLDRRSLKNQKDGDFPDQNGNHTSSAAGESGAPVNAEGVSSSNAVGMSSSDAEGRSSQNTEGVGDSSAENGEGSECCGLHLVCEKELTAIAEDRILYYDDEELDRFAGRTPDEYNSEEIEEFRDVLMTMLPEDVPGWARSLDRRHIQPPQEVRDELLIMLQEIA